MNNAYWTLQIEVKFYILMAIFFLFCKNRNIYWLLVFLLAMNLCVLPYLHRGSTVLTHLVSFFPGIVAAKAEIHGWKKIWPEFVGITFLVSANFFVFLVGDMAFYLAIYAILLSGLFALAVTLNRKNRPMAFLATISYSLYLCHTVIGYPFIDYALARFSHGDGIIIGLLGASVMSLLAAALFYYGIERTSIRFGRAQEFRLKRP
jgi:peptidoglycan/LPS O-acetylase OafA/YrhL